jgi:hypothetical protein
LRSAAEDEAGTAFAVEKLDRATGFLAAEDGDQAFLKATLAQDVLDHVFFAVTALEVMVRGSCSLSHGLGMGNQGVGLLLDERHEILTAHLERRIDEAIKVSVVAEGEITLENNSIKAAEYTYNGLGEFLREAEVCRHGVLLPGCREITSIG